MYDRANYAQLIKLYGALPTGRESYRPAKIKGTVLAEIMGMPAPKRILPISMQCGGWQKNILMIWNRTSRRHYSARSPVLKATVWCVELVRGFRDHEQD